MLYMHLVQGKGQAEATVYMHTLEYLFDSLISYLQDRLERFCK